MKQVINTPWGSAKLLPLSKILEIDKGCLIYLGAFCLTKGDAETEYDVYETQAGEKLAFYLNHIIK